MNIRVAREWIDKCQLSAPVIGEASQMRNDERHGRIFGGEQIDHGNLADDVVKNRQRERSRYLAYFARNARIVSMQFDSYEAVVFNGSSNKIEDSAAVSFGMDKRKSVKAIRPAGHDLRNFAVCL